MKIFSPSSNTTKMHVDYLYHELEFIMGIFESKRITIKIWTYIYIIVADK